MPIYEYKCKKGHTFEVMQRMADDSLEKCTACGAPVQRVFHPIAVHFKGSGFYNTDYGKRKRGSSEEGSDGDGNAGSGDDAKKAGDGSSSGEAKGSSSESKGSGGGSKDSSDKGKGSGGESKGSSDSGSKATSGS